MLFAQRAGVAIVVIVALAGLVVLGGGGSAVYFIETIEKTDMQSGISVKKRNISIYGITSTCVTHQPKAMHDNVRATHLRYGR